MNPWLKRWRLSDQPYLLLFFLTLKENYTEE